MKKIFAAMNMYLFGIENIKGTECWLYYAVIGGGATTYLLLKAFVTIAN